MLEALFGGEIGPPQKFLPNIAQLFYFFRFGQPAPQGQEIAKYWFLGHFGLGQPLAPEKFWTENTKTQFAGARGTFGENIRNGTKETNERTACGSVAQWLEQHFDRL